MTDARTVRPGEVVTYHNEPRKPAAPVVASAAMVTLTLPLADCLNVGQTLRALAAAGKPNAGTAETFARVGQLLIDAAKPQMESGK